MKQINENGYVTVMTDDGWKLEHVMVMEKAIGRPLLPGTTVHHKDRDRANNEPHNLELWYTPQPAGTRVADMIDRFLADGAIAGLTPRQLDVMRASYERELLPRPTARDNHEPSRALP